MLGAGAANGVDAAVALSGGAAGCCIAGGEPKYGLVTGAAGGGAPIGVIGDCIAGGVAPNPETFGAIGPAAAGLLIVCGATDCAVFGPKPCAVGAAAVGCVDTLALENPLPAGLNIGCVAVGRFGTCCNPGGSGCCGELFAANSAVGTVGAAGPTFSPAYAALICGCTGALAAATAKDWPICVAYLFPMPVTSAM